MGYSYRIRGGCRVRKRPLKTRSRSYYAMLREIPAARLTPSELDYAMNQILKAKPIEKKGW